MTCKNKHDVIDKVLIASMWLLLATFVIGNTARYIVDNNNKIKVERSKSE